MWGTTRLLHHVSLTMLWASITELWAKLSLSENPRWLPNCMTYIVSDTLMCGGPQGFCTMKVWPCCRQALLGYGHVKFFRKSKMAAKLRDLHGAWHTCMWGTTRLLHHVSFNWNFSCWISQPDHVKSAFAGGNSTWPKNGKCLKWHEMILVEFHHVELPPANLHIHTYIYTYIWGEFHK